MIETRGVTKTFWVSGSGPTSTDRACRRKLFVFSDRTGSRPLHHARWWWMLVVERGGSFGSAAICCGQPGKRQLLAYGPRPALPLREAHGPGVPRFVVEMCRSSNGGRPMPGSPN